MRETWHERYTRIALLPPEMAEFTVVSFSLQRYLSMVNRHLMKIYGERADWKKNIHKYLQSQEYLSRCRTVNSIDDIPLLTIDQIKLWITEEEQYTQNVEKLIALLPNISSENRDIRVSAVMDAARILGLLGKTSESLYHYIIDYNNMQEAEWETILSRIHEHFSEYEIAVNALIRLFVNGRLVTYPVLETVMTQQKQKYLYRGENAYYGSSKPSAFRKSDSSEPDWLTGRLSDLRREEGVRLLDEIVSVISWHDSTPNWIALAQHYGLKTTMMDVTSDILAALFFATCKYENGNWRPLKKSEFANVGSRPHVYNRGGDSRYAILYRKPFEISEIEWLFVEGNKIEKMIFPVGYQPFMRCSSQHAYGFIVDDINYDIYRDEGFEKYKIQLTKELCNWVFQKANKGKDIYPEKDIPNIEQYFERINKTTFFSRDVFEEILSARNIPRETWVIMENELKQYGFYIAPGRLHFITGQELADINNSYPHQTAKGLTGNDPFVDPLVVIMSDSEQSRRDRELDDEKYRFMRVNVLNK